MAMLICQSSNRTITKVFRSYMPGTCTRYLVLRNMCPAAPTAGGWTLKDAVCIENVSFSKIIILCVCFNHQ